MSSIADLAGVYGLSSTDTSKKASKSTNTKAGMELDMTSYLQLMVASLQNQTMDNSMDTSDMMNQMVQMTVVQAIGNISETISQSSALSYAASLVGKEVTVGQYVGSQLKEIVGEVTGTGVLNGEQVIFMGDDSYYLSDIMAVGRLPAEKTAVEPETVEPEAVEGSNG